MRRLLSLLAAVLVLAVPATASAHKAVQHPASAHKAHGSVQQVSTDPVALAVERAEAYWRTIPCDGHIAIAMGEAEPHHVAEGTTVMWSSFIRGEPASDCTVHLNPKLWPNWEQDDLSFGEFCQAMVYEFGHFLGHRDEGEHPGEAFLLGGQVPQCRTWRLDYGQYVFTQRGQSKSV
jgi:hypothetical protein